MADMTTDITTRIDFSEIESATLGLKIGRCNADFFDEQELYRQIVEEGYDICRVKVSAEDEYAPLRLSKMGLPAFFSGSIRRYKTPIKEQPSGNYNYPDMVWELYDGTQHQLLKEMLVGTWGDYPIGYYRTPYLCELTNKEVEIESVFRFYKKHNLTADYPENSIVFMKHNGNYVGFFALNKVNGNLESHIGGILAPYRKGGYFLDKLRYIKEFCLKHDLKHFIFGARNENAEVQRIFQHVGFQPVGSENVFHLAPLLSHSEKDVCLKSLNTKGMDEQQLIKEIYGIAYKLSSTQLSGKFNFSFNVNFTDEILKESNPEICLSFPVVSNNEIMVVAKCNTNNKNKFTSYYRQFREA